MKIIGKTDRGYICEVSEGDIAALLGETSFQYGKTMEKLLEMGLAQKDGYGSIREKLIGATISLEGRFRRVVDIEARHRELKGVGKTLRQLSDLLDSLGNEVLLPPAKEPTA